MNVSRHFPGVLLYLVVVLLLVMSGCEHRGQITSQFYNILLQDGADPWVCKHTDGFYYLTCTNQKNVTVWRSRSLTGLGAGEKKIVWFPSANGPYSKHVWAPELHWINNRWYIYVTAGDGRIETQRIIVLENGNNDPFQGQFKLKGKLQGPISQSWAIDGTVFKLHGVHYFVWSGLAGNDLTRQNLYIARMTDPLTLAESGQLISAPTQKWESSGNRHINEAPQVLIKGDKIHIVYSAGPSWADGYCLGLLTADIDSDLLSKSSWKKRDQPIFQTANGVYGPGHCCFVKSRDRKEDWIIYHAARHSGSGWSRNIRAQCFRLGRNNTPEFGKPVGPNMLIALPSGDPPRIRYEAEEATLANGSRVIKQDSASGGAKVGYINHPDSYVEFAVHTNRSGFHNLEVRFANGSASEKQATHILTVNGSNCGTINYVNTGWNEFSNSWTRLELKQGLNKVRFTKGLNHAEIDCIDVFPVLY